MQLDRDVELMSRVPLFQGLCRDQLELMAFSSERLVYLPGDKITEKGMAGDAAYMILSGAVKRPGQAYIDFPDQYFFDGALLGELAMLVEFRHTETQFVLDETVVLEFTRTNLHLLMQRFPQIGLHLADKLAARLSEFSRQYQAMEAERRHRRKNFYFAA